MPQKGFVFLGMSGVGKTTFGKMFAKKYDLKFVDVDELIEKRESMTVSQCLHHYGSIQFLKIEEDVVCGLNFSDKAFVCSPGGSVVYSEKSMKFFSSHAYIVYLKDDCAQIASRIHNLEERGIVGVTNEDEFKVVCEERSSIYESYADLTIVYPKLFEIETVFKNIEKILTPYLI